MNHGVPYDSKGVKTHNGNDGILTTALPHSNMQMNPDEHGVRLAPLMELTIVGGLGVIIMIAPNIATFVKQKLQHVKTRIIFLKDRLGHTKITKKLEMLNRRRKYGSIVRVIGSVLPSSLFSPPCRIYIPNWAQLENNKWDLHQYEWNVALIDVSKKPDFPSENDVGDGLIEAFEIDSEVISILSGDEDEEEEDNASSSPEGWTQEQRKFVGNFNPTLLNITNSSYARCSTPKTTLEDLQFNASQINHHGSKLYEDQADITDLKKMVEGLMLQINCLNQSLLATQNQLAAQQYVPATNGVQLENTPLPPPAPVVAPPVGLPPPPPPPPPPMPPMPTSVNKPLVIVRKGNQDKLLESKPQITLSDVLKELPNAKLRRIERSPGGTPIKPQLKLPVDKAPLDIGNHLAVALRKRYESMHSPVCEPDTDKENMDASDNSFEDSPVTAKRVLFQPNRTPLRVYCSNNDNQKSENCSPFGQHLLKKRKSLQTQKDVSPSTQQPAVLALREQN